MTHRRRRRKALLEYAVHALLLFALLVPIFPGVFLRGEVAFPGNFIYMYAPWRAHMPDDLEPQNAYIETPRQANAWYCLTAQAIHDGEWPLWNPYQFTGISLIGAYQTAVFYPPRLLFLLFDDVYVAFTAFMLFKLWLAGMLAYVCARHLSIATAYARFFSIAYMLGGYMVTAACYPTVDSLGWAPLLFLGFEFIIDGRWLRGFAASFVASSMMAFAAGAQHTLTFCLVLGVYFLVRLAGRNSAPFAICAIAVASGAIIATFLVTSIQILPFIETMSHSLSILETLFESRSGEYHLTFDDLPVLWSPRYFGTYLHGNYWGRMNAIYVTLMYIGIPCWLGAILAVRAKSMPELFRIRVRYLLLASLVGLLLAFDFPILDVVHQAPGLKNVRPVYFMTFFVFGVPMAATMSLQHWFGGAVTAKRFLLPAIAAIAILGFTLDHVVRSGPTLSEKDQILSRQGTLVDVLLVDGKPGVPLESTEGTLSAFVLRQVAWSAVIFALALASLAIAFLPPARRFGIVAITGVAILDFLAAWHHMQPTSKREHVFPSVEVLDRLRQRGHPYRVSVAAIGIDALQIPYGIEETHGYDAMIPKRFWNLLERELSKAGWEAFEPALSVPCYLLPASEMSAGTVPKGFEVEEVQDGIILAKNPRALPRARLVGNVETFNSLRDIANRMNAAGFDPSNLALVEKDSAPPYTSISSAPPGVATITDWTWNSVRVDVNATQEAVLVLAEAYYPGWEARIDDDHEIAIFPVYHIFRGAQVPAGEHSITFRYSPPSFRLGAALSVSALVVLALTGVYAIFRRRAKIPLA